MSLDKNASPDKRSPAGRQEPEASAAYSSASSSATSSSATSSSDASSSAAAYAASSARETTKSPLPPPATPVIAEEKRSYQFSLVWVIPLLALLLSGFLIWNNTINNGPTIKLTISSADGIEEGKTLVKIRSVTVGVVTDVALASDFLNTVLTIQMDKDTEELLRRDTSFWVVRPRIENAGISGLDTLLSGPYIQMNMGSTPVLDNDYFDEYVALTDPPLRDSSDKGIIISLTSDDSLKLSYGDLVTFRGFKVGVITDAKFDLEQEKVHYKAFIREPYDKLVHSCSAFWISSGVELSLKPNGLDFRTESLDNLLVGGVAFDNFVDSDHMYHNDKITDDTEFVLHHKREEARLSSLENSLLYVVMLEGNIHSIAPGSPVLFRGVQVGEVVKAPWLDDASQVFTASAIPVLISINSNRNNRQDIAAIFNEYMHGKSLCAAIGSANLIMSNNQIELVHDAKSKCSTQRDIFQGPYSSMVDGLLTYKGYGIIPLIPSESLSAQMDAFMAKLNSFDVAGLSTELQNSLKAFTTAMNSFSQSNSEIERTQVITKLATAFENFNNSVKGYGPDTVMYRTLMQTMKNIEQILQDLSPVMTEVGQKPTSLIFGGPDDPIPQAVGGGTVTDAVMSDPTPKAKAGKANRSRK